MEGTTGIILEAPQISDPMVTTSEVLPKNVSKQSEKADGQKTVVKEQHLDKQNDIDTVDSLEEKVADVVDFLDILGDQLSNEDRKLLKKYLPETGDLQSFENQDKGSRRFLDSAAEILRTLAIILALVALAIFHQKETYSGKDLQFSDTPPEGNISAIDELLSQESNKKSWINFKKEVTNLPEMSFSQFMANVLEANARHAPKIMKSTKAESQTKRKLQTPRNSKKLGGKR